jgi:hypothetical protein
MPADPLGDLARPAETVFCLGTEWASFSSQENGAWHWREMYSRMQATNRFSWGQTMCPSFIAKLPKALRKALAMRQVCHRV